MKTSSRATPPFAIGRAIVSAIMMAIQFTIAGCATDSRAPRITEASVRAFAEQGYVVDQRFAIATVRETWQSDRAQLDVSFVAPTTGGIYPLVIYMPGLGESASAGELWRNAWAAAGYAVLAFQAVEVGEALWRSSRARAGEFRSLAREQFAAAALQVRLHQIQFVLDQLAQRANQAPFAAADLKRVVIAGFDLGAQTALAAAGETTTGVTLIAANWNLRGVIALSPYVDLAAGGLQTRFTTIRGPVLTITGTDDLDPYGLVGSAGLRQAPWQGMPAGDKYALLLTGGPHAVLAGSSLSMPDSTAATAQSSGPARDSPPRGRRLTGDSAVDGLHQMPGGSRRGRGQENDPGPSSRSSGQLARVQAFDPHHIAAIQSVSTAFLDAIAKARIGEAELVAREWLTRDAPRFLGRVATLQTK